MVAPRSVRTQRRAPEEGAKVQVSISSLNKHIHSLRKEIRLFEEKFEKEKNYKRLDNGGNSKPDVEETVRTLSQRLGERRRELGLPNNLKRRAPEEGAKVQVSISSLNKHIHSLRKQIRLFEEKFEKEKNYKPAHNDKTAHPEVAGLIKQLSKSRKQLKAAGRETQGVGSADNLKEMSQSQMSLEKTTLQKCLLHYEGLHGRPLLLASSASPVITTIVMSPLEEVRLPQPPAITMATLHEASRSAQQEQLRTTRVEKKRLRLALREFEQRFYAQTGRTCQKEDRGPMDEEYCQYKNVKVKLRLLEALLSKQQDSTKTS
ncbi:hypothetical protein CRUP_016332 [Coryphaenoides rupestris]|nr:hypothetical protein CRUP_016332 [Coryphaenoides rupestris]